MPRHVASAADPPMLECRWKEFGCKQKYRKAGRCIESHEALRCRHHPNPPPEALALRRNHKSGSRVAKKEASVTAVTAAGCADAALVPATINTVTTPAPPKRKRPLPRRRTASGTFKKRTQNVQRESSGSDDNESDGSTSDRNDEDLSDLNSEDIVLLSDDDLASEPDRLRIPALPSPPVPATCVVASHDDDPNVAADDDTRDLLSMEMDQAMSSLPSAQNHEQEDNLSVASTGSNKSDDTSDNDDSSSGSDNDEAAHSARDRRSVSRKHRLPGLHIPSSPSCSSVNSSLLLSSGRRRKYEWSSLFPDAADTASNDRTPLNTGTALSDLETKLTAHLVKQKIRARGERDRAKRITRMTRKHLYCTILRSQSYLRKCHSQLSIELTTAL
jgi:hypothetical protein